MPKAETTLPCVSLHGHEWDEFRALIHVNGALQEWRHLICYLCGLVESERLTESRPRYG